MAHVLVVGNGARAHALAWKIVQSPHVHRISVAPGNAGTGEVGKTHNVDIDATDVVSLLDFAETERVDLTIVGPEESLARGMVDQFEAAGLRIFGPHRQAAMIEISKSYAKQVMMRQHVPTAPHEVFTDLDTALDYVMTHPVTDVVIKADGLARGKGVFWPKGESDAEGILRALLQREALGGAGRKVIIERRLTGPEISIMAFTDSQSLVMMPAISDYRRLYDNDMGPNTTGMGAYTSPPVFTTALADQVRRTILEPILAGLMEDHCCFKGVLNVNVVLTESGPLALELNARFGDPGAQSVLPLLESDLFELLSACVDNQLAGVEVRWNSGAAVTVVLATANFPERPDPGLPILLAPHLPDGVLVFHYDTRYADDQTLVTTGGRVFSLVGIGPDLPSAVALAYDATRRVHFDGMHYRTDIGARALWGW
jgi:phosphoribosylamine--glycine ligase